MKNKINILITGGAGFIGSNLVEYFLNDERVNIVRVLDNLSNGYFENIKKYTNNSRFEFIEGDIRDYDTCLKACKGINKITHQAALGSVPRSIENPMLSTEVNILGTVNLMYAAVQEKVERIVLAFSSSTYGDHTGLPKVENIIGNPLSPYAVTKASIEQFADVFQKTYGIKWIGLRYFNIFGPNQMPNNPYAAVIPIFINSILNNKKFEIYGDGETCRDFTYVENAVLANELSLFTENQQALNEVYNIACGETTSLNELVEKIEIITNKSANFSYKKERKGDVKKSLANISKAERLLNYKVKKNINEGLEETVSWITKNQIIN